MKGAIETVLAAVVAAFAATYSREALALWIGICLIALYFFYDWPKRLATLVNRPSDNIRKRRNIFRNVSAVVAAVYVIGSVLWLTRDRKEPAPSRDAVALPAQPPAELPKSVISVSITCLPEVLPLKGNQGDSLYAILLHPKWKDNLLRASFRTGPDGQASVWPDLRDESAGYQCQILNGSTESLIGAVLTFQVSFGSARAFPKSRSVQIVLPESLLPNQRLSLHIADDTGWDPAVVPPKEVTARIGSGNDSKLEAIQVQYPAVEGGPPTLRGFGPLSSNRKTSLSTSRVGLPPDPESAGEPTHSLVFVNVGAFNSNAPAVFFCNAVANGAADRLTQELVARLNGFSALFTDEFVTSGLCARAANGDVKVLTEAGVTERSASLIIIGTYSINVTKHSPIKGTDSFKADALVSFRIYHPEASFRSEVFNEQGIGVAFDSTAAERNAVRELARVIAKRLPARP